MKRIMTSVSATLVLVLGLAAVSAFGVERHPAIHAAIDALEQAKADMNAAAHDFCGHKVEAIEATDRALDQLRKALEFDKAEVMPTDLDRSKATTTKASYAPFAHPKIKAAINALQRAKSDMENAKNDFGGHKAEAIEATNKAIEQLGLALGLQQIVSLQLEHADY